MANFTAAVVLTVFASLSAGIRDVLPALERCLADSDDSVRGGVALAIKRIQGKGART